MATAKKSQNSRSQKTRNRDVQATTTHPFTVARMTDHNVHGSDENTSVRSEGLKPQRKRSTKI
jgi:hypothetical protein